jgi:hypothetical protein
LRNADVEDIYRNKTESYQCIVFALIMQIYYDAQSTKHKGTYSVLITRTSLLTLCRLTTYIQDESVNQAISHQWGGCRYRHFAANVKAF